MNQEIRNILDVLEGPVGWMANIENAINNNCLDAQINTVEAEIAELYDLLPTGDIDAWELLKTIKAHMNKLGEIVIVLKADKTTKEDI